MRSPRPVIGHALRHRTFTPRTCIEAFGTPFYAPTRRRLDMDHVIGIACVLVVVGIAISYLFGLIS